MAGMFSNRRRRGPGQAPELRKLRVFLAYRRGEGDEYVSALNRNLEGRIIAERGVPRFQLETFFDRLTPFSGDWKRYWNVHLRTARAMLLVCTETVPHRRAGGDFVHQELDTWIRHRRTICPILVDARGLGKNGVPTQILNRWPDAERLDWPEQKDDEARLYRRIEEGILMSAVGVDEQDLGRIRRRNMFLRWACLVAILLAVIAGLFAAQATVSRYEAEAARGVAEGEQKRARRSELEAIHQANVAESRRLAIVSDVTLPGHLDRALLLALEAERGGSKEARTSLIRCLQSRPDVVRFLHFRDRARVTSVAVGPKGILAAAHEDGQDKCGVTLLDMQGRPLRAEPSPIPEGRVSSLTFGPGGIIAAGYNEVKGAKGGVVLLDARGERLRDEPNLIPEGTVRSVAFGPGGVLCAAYGRSKFKGKVGKDGSIEISSSSSPNEAIKKDFDFMGGVVLMNAQGERSRKQPAEIGEGEVTSLAFGPGGILAAGYTTAGATGGVALFDLGDEHLAMKRIEVPEGKVTSVASGRGFLAAGYATEDDKGGVILFFANGERYRNESLAIPEGRVHSVAFGPDRVIAVGYGGADFKGGVVLLDAYTVGKRLRTQAAPLTEGQVYGLGFGPDGVLAAGYSGDDGKGGVVLIDARGERLRSRSTEMPEERLRWQLSAIPEGSVTSIAFGPGGTVALGYAAESKGGVVLLGADGRRLSAEPTVMVLGLVRSVAFAADGTITAGYINTGYPGAEGTGGVMRLDARGKPLHTMRIDAPEGKLTRMAIGPDGLVAAVYRVEEGPIDARGGLVLFDANDGRPRPGLVAIPEGQVDSVAFGPRGSIAVAYNTAHRGRGVVWMNAEGVRIGPRPVTFSEGYVMSVTFDPREGLLAGYDAGSPGGAIVPIDGRGASRREEFAAIPEGGVSSMAFGPGGVLAVGYTTTSDDGGVVLLDPKGHRLRTQPVAIPEGRVGEVVFGPRGVVAAVFTHKGKGGVVLLDGGPNSWCAKAARVANRNLTWAEWREFFPGRQYHRTVRAYPLPEDLPEEDRTRVEARPAEDWERLLAETEGSPEPLRRIPEPR